MLIACFLVGRFHSLSLATDTHKPPGLSMDVHSLAQHRVLEQRRKLPSPLDALINHINHDMSAEDELIEERKRQAMARAEAKARRVAEHHLGAAEGHQRAGPQDGSTPQKERAPLAPLDEALVQDIYRHELFARADVMEGGGGESMSQLMASAVRRRGPDDAAEGAQGAVEHAVESPHASSMQRAHADQDGRFPIKEKAQVVHGERSMTFSASAQNWSKNRRLDGVYRNFPYEMDANELKNRMQQPMRNAALNRQLRNARAAKLEEDEAMLDELAEACEQAMERQEDGEKLRLGRIPTSDRWDFSGELRRRGQIATWGWSPGFYVLVDGKLIEFTGTALASQIVAVWPVLAATCRRGAPSSQAHPHVFELHLNPRFVDEPVLATIELAAPTKEERQAWIAAIERASLRVAKHFKVTPEAALAERQRQQEQQQQAARLAKASSRGSSSHLAWLFGRGDRSARGGRAGDTSAIRGEAMGVFRVREASPTKSPPPSAPSRKGSKATGARKVRFSR